MGWSNSQPLDILHNAEYDLLRPAGRQLLCSVLDRHWPFLTVLAFPCTVWSNITNLSPHLDWAAARRAERRVLSLVVRVSELVASRGRYFLVEQPWSARSWVYDRVLERLWRRADVWVVRCDQCAYGQRDTETGQPIEKATGFMTNAQAVANELARRCSCPAGAHQVMGANRHGPRAKQAAEYPEELAKAVCRGVQRQMKIDYAAHLASERAFPVDERERSRSPGRQQPQQALRRTLRPRSVPWRQGRTGGERPEPPLRRERKIADPAAERGGEECSQGHVPTDGGAGPLSWESSRNCSARTMRRTGTRSVPSSGRRAVRWTRAFRRSFGRRRSWRRKCRSTWPRSMY